MTGSTRSSDGLDPRRRRLLFRSWHRGTREEHPDWSEMEYQMRNWMYYTWLSGDHIAEQAVHSLDKIAWAMKDVPPTRVVCTGGREVRPDVPTGNNIFDHFATAWFDWLVKGDQARRAYLQPAADGALPGFQARTAVGLRLEHLTAK